MNNKIITIQSQLGYGYVGNNVAGLIIQLHGFDVIALPTVLFSSHTGHKEVYGAATDPDLFQNIIKGIKTEDFLDNCGYILSGYFGSCEIIDLVCDFVTEFKQNNPDRIYVCDPVMGDTAQGGLYVSEKIAERIIERLIPVSDIITPNHFEIEYILNCKIHTIEQLLNETERHPVLKNKIIVITSAYLQDTPENKMEVIVLRKGKAVRLNVDKIKTEIVGTGDLFASVLTSQLALNNDMINSVNTAIQYINDVISYAHGKGYVELNAESLLIFQSRLIK